YHVQSGNRGNFLSLDFGLREFGVKGDKERLRRYRRFLYETGAVEKGRGAALDSKTVRQEREKDFRISRMDRFKYRTRYFTDSGIIGGRAFVIDTYQKVKESFQAKKNKVPKPVAGLNGIYSLKRLTE
ncbi:MAG: hypothetical protein V2B19_27540, partial [Pseudomonadota bacterium]